MDMQAPGIFGVEAFFEVVFEDECLVPHEVATNGISPCESTSSKLLFEQKIR